jgi:hypothetical protein
MMNGFYEKTPSLSLRLRVARTSQSRKSTSDILEYHSSSFELIRVSDQTAMLLVPNKLEFSRISSNNLEQGSVAYG